MEFTSKQKEIVARKMGYDGPMQMFDEFLAASPSDAQRYSAITSKFAERMAKGGMVKPKKMFDGGFLDSNMFKSVANAAGDVYAGGSKSYDSLPEGYSYTRPKDSTYSAVEPEAGYKYAYGPNGERVSVKQSSTTTTAPDTKPVMNTVGTTYEAATTDMTPGMTVSQTQAAPVQTVTAAQAVESTGVNAPTPVTAPTVTAATAAPAVRQAVEGVQAEQGVVSQQAQVQAAEQAPTTTAVAGMEAAQGTAAQVEAAPILTVKEDELVSGSAVDKAKVEQTIAEAKAAQGVVTEEMTVQGQLNKMLSNFDAGNPPAWAAGSLRAATAQLAARGLGASSLAGQAIIQAALEAATPIATADAKVFETMGITNLSNRQAMAVLTAQQRADFLKQEFDQDFQTRVVNAARIADVADKNFDAQTQVVLENARLTNTMNIANLSARNALIMEKAAAMSRLEVQNLNNRQQAAVANAQAFLQMDMKNLDLKQQVNMFKAQEIADAIVSDTGFENAARATNATNTLEANKISATLALTAQQFNATERNKVALANMDAQNAMIKFNAQEANDRAEFNANLASQINIANAKILADISVANTAAINAAYAVNAKNSTELSAAAYAQQSQTYRDLLSMSWKTGEQEKDRTRDIMVATINKSAATSAAQIKADSDSWTAIAKVGYEIWKNT